MELKIYFKKINLKNKRDGNHPGCLGVGKGSPSEGCVGSLGGGTDCLLTQATDSQDAVTDADIPIFFKKDESQKIQSQGFLLCAAVVTVGVEEEQ